MYGRAIEILLVEDNPGDVELTLEAFKDCKVRNNLSVVEDGVEAVDYLRKEGKYADAKRPDFILLDLNLPRMLGRDVLAELKAAEELRRIPVVILTSSDGERDLRACLGEGANCYVIKPIGLRPFREAVHSIAHFWIGTARLPAHSS